MKLTLRLDPNRLRRWHLRLAERLARRRDTQVGVEWGAGAEPLPGAVALLFSLERLIYGLPPGDEMAAAPGELARFAASADAADLVLDFTNAPPRAGTRTWRVTFDGGDEAAALAALADKRHADRAVTRCGEWRHDRRAAIREPNRPASSRWPGAT